MQYTPQDKIKNKERKRKKKFPHGIQTTTLSVRCASDTLALLATVAR